MSYDLDYQVPRDFNAAAYFIDRHLQEGRADKLAVIDDTGEYTYAQLAERVNRVGSALQALGLHREERVACCVHDSFSFPALFWGAIKGGFVPLALNTRLHQNQYDYLLRDSRATVLIVSEDVYRESYAAIAKDQPFIRQVIIDGASVDGFPSLDEVLASASAELEPAVTTCDDVAFWLYSSGTTSGNPKGIKHTHASLYHTAQLMGRKILDISEDDIAFSAPKAFFAYGLGNGMTFPFAAGATTVFMAGRPTPDSVLDVLRKHKPTIFAGVPTLYAAMLATIEKNPEAHPQAPLRRCLSAGEALPEEIGLRWRKVFNVDLLDGLGSTEMLNNFLCNQPGEVRYGTVGKPVPGYTAKLMDDAGEEVPEGEMGEMWICGPSMADGYWNQREKHLDTFIGRWMRTGDKFIRDADGYYHFYGRADDLFKSGGNWVSPAEIESTLAKHDKVLEAGVVPREDKTGNQKPCAFVVLKSDADASEELVEELKMFVKERIELWKYPRWIEFRNELPKTATGKIQRFKLRQEVSS